MRIVLLLAISALPLSIANAEVGFVDDIAPILTRKGCSGSNCHGSVRGKNGFKLSLFNSDTEEDFKEILSNDDGRRVNWEQLEQSLILRKPSFQVTHGGGVRFAVDSPEYRTILEWLASGAPYRVPGRPELRNLEVSPAETILEGPETEQRLTVMGIYSDGSRRDLSQTVNYASQEETVAAVDDSGKVTARARGETAIMVRMPGLAAVARIAVITEPLAADYLRVPRNNVIDELVFDKLQKLGIVASDLADDKVFIRRVYLDTIGVLPTPEETHRFLSSRDPNKREKLIDHLLERPEFAQLWAAVIADLFQVGWGTGLKGGHQLFRWLRGSLEENKPYDRLVRELLMGSGPFVYTPTPNFFVGLMQGPEGMATQFSQAVLGVRLECAKCHDHPFERWSRDDYFGLAAFFSRLERKEEPYGRFEHTVAVRPNHKPVYDYLNNKELKHPETGEYVRAKFLGGDYAEDGPGEDPRPKLAEWLSRADNPYFARAIVNRIWKHYMGRGLVEGVDDFRITNPPSNEALLGALAGYFIEGQFDLKHLMRLILKSRAYQLSAEPNETNRDDTINYSRFYLKRLMSEALFDAMGQVAGKRLKIPGSPPGEKAISVAVGSGNYFMKTFGKSEFRDVICERDHQPTVTQAMQLISGETVQELLTSPGNLIDKLLERKELSEEERLRTIYVSAYARPPARDERTKILRLLRDADVDQREAVYQDVLWAIFNSKEFAYVH